MDMPLEKEKLESLLGFSFLSHNTFETHLEKKKIQKRGFTDYKEGKVPSESVDLGKKYFQEISSAYICPSFVQKVHPDVGFGLFAAQDILKGSYIGEYTGLIRKNNRLYFEEPSDYCYKYPILDDLGRFYVIDAVQGNLTRFINHSDCPNLKPLYAFYEGFYHVIFIAIENIEKGKQFFYDYGKNYWYTRSLPLPL